MSGHRIHVSPSLKIFDSLTYTFSGKPDALRPGLRVVVPVVNRLTTAWVTETTSHYKGPVKKTVAMVQDRFLPDPFFIDYVTKVSHLYFTSVGTLLDAALPPGKKNLSSLYFLNPESGKKERLSKHPLKALLKLAQNSPIPCFYGAKGGSETSEFSIVSADPETQEINGEAPRHRFLTGYQREDNYIEMIRECLGKGKSVLFTVPDNLTAAYVREFLTHAGIGSVDIYNSDIKPKNRDRIWQQYVLEGKTGVITGGQSAAFLPVTGLGLIISDRAGTAGYKKSPFSPYNINVLARLRSMCSGVPLVEGFSTVTVSSAVALTDPGKSTVSLIDDRPKSEKTDVHVRIVKQRTKGIPDDFIELMSQYSRGGKKILVVLNRKESFNFLYCDSCKKTARCPSCDGFIDAEPGERETFHIKCRRCGLNKESHLLCHLCNKTLSMVESVSIASVKKAIKNRITETGITSLSAEGLNEDHIHRVLQRILNCKIVIATPVIINPFFKGIFDAVIYLKPESYFNLEEYDAAEQIFAITSEFRELVKDGGTVDVFSTFHFHYSLKLINDETAFFKRELKYREWFHLPPFRNLYHIQLKSRSLRELAAEMRRNYAKFEEKLTIKRIYLLSRTPVRGAFKGILEAHAKPGDIIGSGLLKKRDISVEPVLV